MAAFIALQCISPTGGLATITQRRAARRRSISAADELWVDFPGAYGAGINGRLECSARVSREPERGPVERVRLLGEARALPRRNASAGPFEASASEKRRIRTTAARSATVQSVVTTAGAPAWRNASCARA